MTKFINNSIFTRDTCLFIGCTNKQMYKGFYKDNRRIYGKYCNRHRKLSDSIRVKRSMFGFFSKQTIPNKKCTNCGWIGPCDRHRIKPELGYTKDNVIVLCPNCHRLITLGKISKKNIPYL